MPERRERIRVPVMFPFQLNEGSLQERVMIGNLVDLSSAGICLAFKKSPATISHTCSLIIDASPACPSLELSIKILWDHQGDNHSEYKCGGQILSVQEDQREIFRRMIDRLENQWYRIPHHEKGTSEDDLAKARRTWLSKRTGANNYQYMIEKFIRPDEIKANIENFIGVTQVPVGIAGPLKINGEHAKGLFYVPFATTEGTLVATYERGMLAITQAGGARVAIIKNNLDISPVFKFENILEAKDFIKWAKDHFAELKEEAEKTTRHGKLIEIRPFSLGKNVILNFLFYTKDAMGLNMVNIATYRACEYIVRQVKTKGFYLRSNMSSDKKASYFNLINSYGKEVVAEVTFSREILRKYFATTPEKVYDFYKLGVAGSIQAGMIGVNGHFANALAAIFIACGQDVAQIVNASIGMCMCELTEEGNFYMSLKLPNLIVGTVGGGTKIGTQKECLEIMDCYGEDKAEKLAEILAGALMAGEITLYAALSTGSFIHAHMAKRCT